MREIECGDSNGVVMLDRWGRALRNAGSLGSILWPRLALIAALTVIVAAAVGGCAADIPVDGSVGVAEQHQENILTLQGTPEVLVVGAETLAYMTAIVVVTQPYLLPAAAVVLGTALVAGTLYLLWAYAPPYQWETTFGGALRDRYTGLIITGAPAPPQSVVTATPSGYVTVTPMDNVLMASTYQRAQCTCYGAVGGVSCENPGTIDVDMSGLKTTSHDVCTQYTSIACGHCGSHCQTRALGCDMRAPRPGNTPDIYAIPVPTPPAQCADRMGQCCSNNGAEVRYLSTTCIAGTQYTCVNPVGDPTPSTPGSQWQYDGIFCGGSTPPPGAVRTCSQGHAENSCACDTTGVHWCCRDLGGYVDYVQEPGSCP